MSKASDSDTDVGEPQRSAAMREEEAVVERIWQEMQGRVSREQIQKLVIEAENDFADATITLYIPILVHRQVKEKLAVILDDAEATVIWRGVHPTAVEPVGRPSDFTTTKGFIGKRFTVWLVRLFGRQRDRQQVGEWARHV